MSATSDVDAAFADSILMGSATDLPPELVPVARFAQALRERARAEPVPTMSAALRAQLASAEVTPLVAARSARRSLGLAAAAAAAVVALVGVGAAQNRLPSTVQDVVSSTAEIFGIDVPRAEERDAVDADEGSDAEPVSGPDRDSAGSGEPMGKDGQGAVPADPGGPGQPATPASPPDRAADPQRPDVADDRGNGGGTNSGGTNNGGTNSGGTNSGGTNSGGTNNGGSNNGGSNNGGSNNGGSNNGGSNNGGTNSGGTNQGQGQGPGEVTPSSNPNGGTNSGGTNNGGTNQGQGQGPSGMTPPSNPNGGTNNGGTNNGGTNNGGGPKATPPGQSR